MKILSIPLAALLVMNASIAHAQESDPFAELEQEMKSLDNEGNQSDMKEFEAWKTAYLAEYQAFRKEHFQRVDDIRDNLISVWGESEVSSQSEYIEYSKDNKTKTILDFEKNEIRISVLHEANEKVNTSTVEKALKELDATSDKDTPLQQILGKPLNTQSVKALVNNVQMKEQEVKIIKDKNAVIAKEIKLIEAQSLAQEAQVEKIYDLANAGSEATAELDQTTENKIKKEKAQIEKEKQARIASLQAQTAKLGNNSKQRDALRKKKITTYTMPLGNKKDLMKAKPFIGQVKVQSDRWELEPSLLLAIMHTESYFNPKAQSHIPAFGLMQIVPRTAGVDVNRFLYKKDKAMTESYLFQAEKNIETGVAYMHILNSRYLRKITNPESRMYCMIAAYNTGSGNVAKTFNKDKSRNINKAAPIINSLTPQQVYDHLSGNLPYDETKHYLKRVVTRKDIYTSVDSI